jgi:hypothetical protein
MVGWAKVLPRLMRTTFCGTTIFCVPTIKTTIVEMRVSQADHKTLER